MQVTERQPQSWIWLIVGLILLCATTIHGRHLLSAQDPERMMMGPGYYSFAQVSSLDDRPDPSADTAAHVLGDQALLDSSVFKGKGLSRIYAAIMRTKNVPDLVY